jgi:hypothetical protein
VWSPALFVVVEHAGFEQTHVHDVHHFALLVALEGRKLHLVRFACVCLEHVKRKQLCGLGQDKRRGSGYRQSGVKANGIAVPEFLGAQRQEK